MAPSMRLDLDWFPVSFAFSMLFMQPLATIFDRKLRLDLRHKGKASVTVEPK